MPIINPLTIVSAIVGASVCRRVFRFLKGDCDTQTLSARLDPSTFKGKKIWITGASSGIGAELTLQLAKCGAYLILTSRREDVLLQLADQLPCPKERIKVLPLDLSSDTSTIEKVAQTVPSIFGGLDYVFNNAGRSTRVSASELDLQYVQQIMHLNFIAPVALSRAVLPALREAPGGGTIVNTVSIAAYVSTPLRSSYCASKAAIAAYFRCLNLEEPNVNVINIFPGSVKTPIAINSIVQGGKSFGRSDVNIESGLDVERAVNRTLAAVSANIQTSWIANPKELLATRLSNYLPTLWSWIAHRRAVQYRQSIESR